MDFFGIGGVKIGTTVLTGIKSESVSFNPTVDREPSDGQAQSTIASLLTQEPDGAFSTVAVAAALTALSVLGRGLDATTNLLEFFYQSKSGGFPGASGHGSAKVRHGRLIPLSLDLEQGRVATLSFALAMCWDGTNDIFEYSTAAVSLPGDLNDELFTLGTLQLEGAAVQGVQSIRIDFGIELEKVFGDGVGIPYDVNCLRADPTVTIGLVDDYAFDTLGIGLNSINDATIFVQKLQGNGAGYPKASEVHMSIALGSCLTVAENAGASGNELVQSAFRLEPVKTVSAAPIVMATGVVMP